MAAKQKRRTAQPDPDSKKPAKSTSDADLDTALAEFLPGQRPAVPNSAGNRNRLPP